VHVAAVALIACRVIPGNHGM